jgi:hypothetical protein
MQLHHVILSRVVHADTLTASILSVLVLSKSLKLIVMHSQFSSRETPYHECAAVLRIFLWRTLALVEGGGQNPVDTASDLGRGRHKSLSNPVTRKFLSNSSSNISAANAVLNVDSLQTSPKWSMNCRQSTLRDHKWPKNQESFCSFIREAIWKVLETTTILDCKITITVDDSIVPCPCVA